MEKKVIIPTILFIIILFFSIILLAVNKNKETSQKENKEQTEVTVQSTPTQQKTTPSSQEKSEIILFYGNGCPHCAIVEEYIKENKIKDKISFEEKEVYYNQQNSKELSEKAEKCGIPTNSIGVPFLWDGKKCYIGDQDIIDFFKQKINEK